MNKIDYLREFCCGCGLCHSEFGIPFEMNTDGFMKPNFDNFEKSDFCKLEKFCPACYGYSYQLDKNSIWGRYNKILLGWSSDEIIREKASSGGVLSSICIYLLEEKLVDEVIHTGQDLENPLTTTTVISKTKEDIINNCGSRYYSSSPLFNINKMLSYYKRYVIVAKPCDINALKLWIMNNKKYNIDNFYFLSFFCMGASSYVSNLKLAEYLNVKKEDIKNIKYRGDGWPGYTKITDRWGIVKQTDYNTSWGKILGRDLRKACKFCIDGIGENADISCADAWYFDESNNPIFNEEKGRNIIFARSIRGSEVLENLVCNKYIDIHMDNNYIQNLKNIQKSQYERRSTMFARVLALNVFNKNIYHPKYSILRYYCKGVNIIKLSRVFLGTIKRRIKKDL